ncbi:MAG: MarR family transcriptional regulator [Candidatus Dormibacteria bacterium]
MKHFNMNDPELKAATDPCGNLALDPDGRLYDRRIREMLARGPMGQANSDAAEALAALRVAGKAIRLQMDRFAERHGLSEGRLFLIFQLGRAPQHQLPLGEIASHLDVSPRNITGLIDHLEKDGLVERVPDPSDRRSIQARLTPAGLKTLEELWQQARDGQLAMVADFTPDEIAQLRHLCLRLVEKLAGGKPVAVNGTKG